MKIRKFSGKPDIANRKQRKMESEDWIVAKGNRAFIFLYFYLTFLLSAQAVGDQGRREAAESKEGLRGAFILIDQGRMRAAMPVGP